MWFGFHKVVFGYCIICDKTARINVTIFAGNITGDSAKCITLKGALCLEFKKM